MALIVVFPGIRRLLIGIADWGLLSSGTLLSGMHLSMMKGSCSFFFSSGCRVLLLDIFC